MNGRTRVFVGVFALAALIRVAMLLTYWESPFLDVPLVDARDVHLKAVAIAEEGGHPPRPFDRPPLLTYVTAFVYRIFGPEMRHMVVLHLMVGTITAVVTAGIASRLVPGRTVVAGVAGGLYALSRLPIFGEMQLLNEALQVVLMTTAMAAAIDAHDHRSGRRFLLAALAGGLAVLARPTSVFPLGAVLAWAVVHRAERSGPRLGWRSVIAGCLILVGLVASVTLRNRIVGGEWIPISYNGGINFFIGNARNHEDLQNVRPGLRWERLVQNPRALEVTNVYHVDPWRDGARAWDARYVRAALDDVAAAPAAAVGRWAKKAAQFWSVAEIDRNLAPSIFFPDRSPQRWATIPFWVIGPLGLAGLILLGIDRHRLAVPMALWVGGGLLTCIVFFVASRYRAPVYPPLAAAAAYFGWRVWEGGRRSVALGVLAATALFAALDLGGARRIAPARVEFLNGLVWERSGRSELALEAYERARTSDPNDPDVCFQPTAIYLNTGRPRPAAALAERAVALIPDHPSPRFNLGLARAQLGDAAGAVAAFDALVEVAPRDGRYRYQLGMARLGVGDAEGALGDLRRAASLAPAVPLPWEGIAEALEALGRHGEAADARVEAARRGGRVRP